MNKSIPLDWLGNMGQYTSGNYNTLYWLELGQYPQTSAGTVQPAGTVKETESPYGAGTELWVNSKTGEKFAKKGTTYYKVEPVRWLVIGQGGTDTRLPIKNNDNLTKTQLLLISEKIIDNMVYNDPRNTSTSTPGILWADSQIYNSFLPNLKNNLFNNSELSFLGRFTHDNSQLNILSNGSLAYKYNNYCDTNQLKSSKTAWTGTVEYYWLSNSRTSASQYMSSDCGLVTKIHSTYGTTYSYYCDCTDGVRPIIILNNVKLS